MGGAHEVWIENVLVNISKNILYKSIYTYPLGISKPVTSVWKQQPNQDTKDTTTQYLPGRMTQDFFQLSLANRMSF